MGAERFDGFRSADELNVEGAGRCAILIEDDLCIVIDGAGHIDSHSSGRDSTMLLNDHHPTHLLEEFIDLRCECRVGGSDFRGSDRGQRHR